MSEGSLDAPIRHPIDWSDPDFYDEAKLDAELRRVFDVCHGCRRCFNLCNSFPRLFDLIDESKTGELDSVKSKDFKPVVDACTLCDMCFMTKCPYVPPHEFNLDFPHLMLRYRAAEHRRARRRSPRGSSPRPTAMARLRRIFRLANWATDRKTAYPRAHGKARRRASRRRSAEIPRSTLVISPNRRRRRNGAAPALGRKAVLYATCFSNYNNPDIGMAARAVLAEWRRDRSRLSALLRHAAVGAGRYGGGRRERQGHGARSQAVDRQGL